MPDDTSSLTPRQTALRMLTHMHDDASYEDIMRQLRILQHIEWTMQDLELAGFPANDVVEEARSELQRPSEYPSSRTAVVLRSRPLFNWQSLADRSDEDPMTKKATWRY